MKKHLLVLLFLFLFSAACAHAQEGRRTSFFTSSWLEAVVSIEAPGPDGKQRSIGTGFLVRSPNKHIILVTARHVVALPDGQIRPNLGYRINTRGGKSVVISDARASSITKSSWFLSENRDVACRFIVWDSRESSFKFLPQSVFLRSAHLEPGAPLFVLGFPMGLRSEEHAMPILRSGIVARCEEGNILGEVFVFPGNSGGPVVYAPAFPVDQETLRSPVLQGQWIVGLVSESIAYVDQAVSIQSGRPRATFEENSGLVNIVPSDAILELMGRNDVLATDAMSF